MGNVFRIVQFKWNLRQLSWGEGKMAKQVDLSIPCLVSELECEGRRQTSGSCTRCPGSWERDNRVDSEGLVHLRSLCQACHCCVGPAAVSGPEIVWAAGIFPGNQVHFFFPVSCQKPKLFKHTERSWSVSEKVNRKLTG